VREMEIWQYSELGRQIKIKMGKEIKMMREMEIWKDLETGRKMERREGRWRWGW
jgi:hypothetical protein